MGDVLPGLLDDLAAESAALDGVVAPLDASGWRAPTPAEGWTVAHQIGHLAWTDEVAALAATDAVAFEDLAALLATGPDGLGAVDRLAAERATLPPARLLASWRTGRKALDAALRDVPGGTKLPWFGPPMSAASCATARLMETWAHGQDVRDALGLPPSATARLRHVAHLAVRTFGFVHALHDLPVPPAAPRVELTAPDGEVWTFGPDGSDEQVSGPALDFCLLAVQRRHRADLDLTARGDVARRWLDIVQAFAGPPGPGRPPTGA